MLLYGFKCISGAAWIKAAMTGHHRADGVAVKFDGQNNKLSHLVNRLLQSKFFYFRFRLSD